jgi:hypothetical protein
LSREREREAKLLPPRSVPHAHDNWHLACVEAYGKLLHLW